jgi:prolipoprotein diacylglyceryltransferase
LFGLTGLLVTRVLRGKTDGLPLYLVAYGVFRYFIEFLRGDDRGASPVAFLSPSQLTALLLFAVGVFLFWLEGRLRQTAAPAETIVLEDDTGVGGEA